MVKLIPRVFFHLFSRMMQHEFVPASIQPLIAAHHGSHDNITHDSDLRLRKDVSPHHTGNKSACKIWKIGLKPGKKALKWPQIPHGFGIPDEFSNEPNVLGWCQVTCTMTVHYPGPWACHSFGVLIHGPFIAISLDEIWPSLERSMFH